MEDADRRLRIGSAQSHHADPPPDIETLILDRCAGELAQEVGRGASLVELGCGSPAKALLLLTALETPAAYWAIDSSSRGLAETAATIRSRYPALPLTTVHADFGQFEGLPVVRSKDRASGRTLLFLPAARIARLAPEGRAQFLRRIGAETNLDARLIIGVDADDGSSTASLSALTDLGCCPVDRSGINGSRAYSLPRFEALIHGTGWQHAQFWTDGRARFGVHVLRRV
jgi:uncharacterized SAM-dependent methyltransferase